MFDVVCKFQLPLESPWHDAGNALEALRPYAQWLGAHDPTMTHWYLGGDTLEEAHRYEVFADGINAHTAARAVVTTEFKGSRAPIIFLWNGEDSTKTGASFSLAVRDGPYPSDIKLSLSGPVSLPRIGSYKETAEFVAILVKDTNALCCFVYHRTGYSQKMTFKDRPGVGWMLYLPRVLTVQDVPEAGALIPVLKDDKQLGTIIVSVTDAIFNHRDPEHFERAQAIETRLVSQDLLPTWAQMMRPV